MRCKRPPPSSEVTRGRVEFAEETLRRRSTQLSPQSRSYAWQPITQTICSMVGWIIFIGGYMFLDLQADVCGYQSINIQLKMWGLYLGPLVGVWSGGWGRGLLWRTSVGIRWSSINRGWRGNLFSKDIISGRLWTWWELRQLTKVDVKINPHLEEGSHLLRDRWRWKANWIGCISLPWKSNLMLTIFFGF